MTDNGPHNSIAPSGRATSVWSRLAGGLQASSSLELLHIACVALLTLVYAKAPTAREVTLFLYFFPVASSGFFLGCYRTGILSCLSFVLVVGVTVFDTFTTGGVALNTWLLIVAWGAILGGTGLFVGAYSDARNRLLGSLQQSQASRAAKDELTGAASRQSLDAEIQRRMLEWNRNGRGLAMIMVDVDHFKKFNDRYGHRAGDFVLQQTVKTIEHCIREADVLGRFGGEEFAVVLPDADGNEARAAAERIRRSIEQARFPYEGSKLRITVSVGLTAAVPADTPQRLLERADNALYVSKQSGRNCVHFHDGTRCCPYGAAQPTADGGESGAHASIEIASDNFTEKYSGMPHRKIFDAELRRRVVEANRYKRSLSAVLVRIESYADLYEFGKEAERLVLEVTSECIRASIREPDTASRISDDTFAIMLPETDAMGVAVPVQRIANGIAQCKKPAFQGRLLPIEVKVAHAQLSELEDAGQLVERLRSALDNCTSQEPESLDQARSGVSHKDD